MKRNVNEAGIPTRRIMHAVFSVAEVHAFRSSLQWLAVFRKEGCLHGGEIFNANRGTNDKNRINRIMRVADIIRYLS